MKRLFIISLLFFSVGLSQQLIPQITETYNNGNIKSINYHKITLDKPEIVKSVTYYKNGQKKSEGIHTGGIRKRGDRDGLFTWWYENGKKSFETTIKDGKKISSKEWNEDGSPK